MSNSDDVYLYPDSGSFTEVASKLLSVADRPKDVRTDSNGPVPLALVVSQELYERYLALDEPGEPRKRGPGRPRKVQPEAEPEQESQP